MAMSREVEFAIKRYEVFLRDVLAPAVYPTSWPVQVHAWQHTDTRSPVPTVAQATIQHFEPVNIGWQWGPKWSTCWFRVSGTAPAHSGPLHLRFSTATEALVYLPQDGAPARILQGLDVNRDALINHPLVPGQPFTFLIEAACNHPFGVTGFEWDDPEVHARWKSHTPGRLDRCEIAAWSQPAESLARRYAFTLGLLKEMQTEADRCAPLHAALRAATNAVSDRDVAGTAPAAVAMIDQVLASGAGPTASSCAAVGHAHIDTAWLWPLRETRRKCLRTFSNVLGLLERNPDFHFMCSQAQQYEFVRQDNPELFGRIAKAVAKGRWEPIGGMWIEPDANCPSGESLIRQCLHGTRYWTSHFTDQGKQRLLYLPDTFGFPASLPGIMKHCGLDTFITNKLHWNSSNDFPHSTFDWKGIDGSIVLGHNTPGKDYNATMTPRELRRGRQIFDRCHPPSATAPADNVPIDWLQPFGFGDGGGGPTQAMIDYANLAKDAPGLPRTHLSSTRQFLETLHTQRNALLASGAAFPAVDGELYLELHRGTLTTQAWIKKANREAENALGAAEFAAFFAPSRLAAEQSQAIMAELDRAWKLLLLNQFHDILPGSSIGWVYEDARRDFAEIIRIASSIVEESLSLWASQCSMHSGEKLALNPTDTVRNGLTADRSATLAAPAFSLSRAHPPRIRLQCSGDERRLSNGLFAIEIDGGGQITSISPDPASFPDASPRAVQMNQLVMYEDRPHMWDAWDIDATYLDKPEPINDTFCERHIVESSPERIAVAFTRAFGKASRVQQIISLEAGSPLIRVRCLIDWHEDHRLLRVLNSVTSEATDALCGIQCGSVLRPLVPRNALDAAKFEFCAHGFVAVGDHTGGAAILCPDKFGWSARRDSAFATIGTSLLRAPKHPDPDADRGQHEIEYAILPLLTCLDSAFLTHEAERYGTNPIIFAASHTADHDAVISPDSQSWSPFEIEAGCGAQVRVIATKRSEDDPDALIVRLYETAGHGGILQIKWNLPVVNASLVNGLEEPIDLPAARFKWDSQNRIIMSRIGPFGLLTFHVTLDPAAALTAPTARQF
jgi:alpha-mannosidase